MAHRRLLWQLFPSFLVLTLLSVVLIILYSYYIVGDIYLQVKVADLESRLHLVEQQITSLIKQNSYSKIDSLCKDLGTRSQTRFTVILPDGRVIADSDKDPAGMDNHHDRPEILQAARGEIGSSVRYSQTIKSELIYVARVVREESTPLATIRASVPLTFLGQTLQAFKNRFLAAGFFIILIITVVSLFVSRNISKPLEQIMRGIERFSRGDLSIRLEKAGSLEMARLSEALNQMATQLDEKIQAIVQGKNEQQAVLEGMTESVLALDASHRIMNLNQAAAKLFNLDSAMVIGKNVDQIIQNPELHAVIDQTFKSARPVESEITISQEEAYHLQVHSSVISDAASKSIGCVIVLNDVTRLRRLEKVRQDFVANVSHEIRTPLTSIKGFAETLLHGAIDEPETARGFVRIIINQSNRLNAIIEDLLILARLEHEDDRTQLKFKEYPVNQVIHDAVKLCENRAAEKDIKLTPNAENPISSKINPDLLEQALVNLIDNAIKFSPESSTIHIKAAVEDKWVTISVSDQGPGIHKKHLPRLFERFYRIDKARSRNLGGTGLGLAIVKHIAQVHQGRVDVESQPERGSTFFIRIPLKD